MTTRGCTRSSGRRRGRPRGDDVDLVGRCLGNHKLLARVGQGGMGAVYQAEHQVIGRLVAIKVLHERTAADRQMVERFFDEARAANRVRHPGIVDIHDCGFEPEVGPYLVMEYLEGESLGERLQAVGSLPVEEVAAVVARVADVLDTVHAKGIVHRDLKPDNIFLSGPEGQIKVLDFGVALLAWRPGGRLTGERQVFGTPHYMSPEQCAGAAGVDHRTDIYALGVIAYELLAGQPPFDDPGDGKVMAMHQYEPTPSLCAQNPAVTTAQEQVIERALAKEPLERYASAGAFARALAEAAWPDGVPEGIYNPPWLASPTRALPVLRSDDEPIPATLQPETNPSPQRDTAVDRHRPAELGYSSRCPSCTGHPLVPVTLGSVEVDTCGNCRGVWFDQGEVAQVAGESLGVGQHAALASQLGRRVESTEMICPACEEPLATYVFEEHKLEVELCELCGGVWLDHGELAQLQRVNARGILEQLLGRSLG
jgi:serine/threonine protein kinase